MIGKRQPPPPPPAAEHMMISGNAIDMQRHIDTCVVEAATAIAQASAAHARALEVLADALTGGAPEKSTCIIVGVSN